MTVKQLLEAQKLKSSELTGKTWKIRIIEGDRQGSSAYYPKEALESGKHLFSKGVRIFRNHPNSEEKWSQPERRIEDIIGWLSEDAVYDGKDLYANAQFIESEQSRIKELAEAGVIAMSIRASGEMTEGKNGMELKKFTAVHSVDVVTQAGAGGAFDTLVESGVLVPEAQEVLEKKEETELEITQEFIDLMETQARATNALLEKLDAKEVAEAAAKEKAEKEAEEATKPTAAAIAAALVEAELPAKARARVLESVEAGKDLTEAIKAEKEIAAEYLAEAGNSGGNGFIVDEGKTLSESERMAKATGLVYG